MQINDRKGKISRVKIFKVCGAGTDSRYGCRKCTKADFYIILTIENYINNYMNEFPYKSKKDNKEALDFI